MKKTAYNNCHFFLLFVMTVCLGMIVPSFSSYANTDSATTVFLVRHAEKVLDGSDDPDLAPEGKARANELMYILQHVKLDAIYSTPFKRTQQTVLPAAEDKNLKIQNYQPDERGFLEKVLSAHPRGAVLIVGHSNTIPDLANELAGRREFKNLNDGTYDNLFIAQVFPDTPSKIIRMRFGAHTPEK